MKRKLCNLLCFVFLLNTVLLNFQIKNTFANELYKPNDKEVVIFIPGIMGTELYYDSEKVWLPSTKSLKSILKGSASLICDKDGTPLLTDVQIGSPLADSSTLLKETLENTDKYKVLLFGYDWRIDNSINADRLKEFIDINTANDQKVSIIAYSMGGLVTAKYIANGNTEKINKYISIGVPYLGAPKAFYMLETGDVDGFSSKILNKTIKYEISNMQPLYQLLPTKQYFDNKNNYYISTNIITNTKSSKESTKLLIKSFSETENFIIYRKFSPHSKDHLKKAEDFHKSLETILFKDKYALDCIDSYFIIGNGQAGTIERIEEKFEMKNSIPKFKNCIISSNSQGDGTVPVYSANVGGRTNPKKTFFVSEEHSELCNNENVINQVLNILK
ncbi:hypothetical protein LGK97_13680 [Clostridium sp. CS001]|uniref:lipase/acyltransferase domain-containing protein n=1 Tax=Clostridium sp. CS001 TaxID=2880648 RepID=UPI001CF1F847|nr:hypothetical protein [Clostridium sp. CS001]MCB2290791.1 hypothetical protein [Clostridium sp. CS001]